MDINEKIIRFVKNNSILWDTKDINYKNASMKEKKFAELSEELGLSVDQTKKKWHCLRVSFSRAYRKSTSLPLGLASREHKKWKYFDSMIFLRDNYEPASELDLPNNYSPPEPDHDYNGHESYINSSENDLSGCCSLEINSDRTGFTPKPISKKRKHDYYLMKKIESILGKEETADYYFAKMISESLKQFNPKTKEMLKLELHRVIVEFTLKEKGA